MRMRIARALCLIALCLNSAAGLAQVQKVDIVVFGQPSLGGFLQPIIKSKSLDTKNGIEVNFVERTPDAYIAQFNSGEFMVGGSAALLSIATASNQGVKIAYLFNLLTRACSH